MDVYEHYVNELYSENWQKYIHASPEFKKALEALRLNRDATAILKSLITNYEFKAAYAQKFSSPAAKFYSETIERARETLSELDFERKTLELKFEAQLEGMK